MSAWTIYLILQLDNIVNMFTAASIILLAYTVIGFIAIFASAADADASDEEFSATIASARIKKTGIIGVLCLVLAVFLPSSKTAAAIYLIPAIANNETIQQEAAELYSLAKEALTNLVKEETNE